MFTLLKSKLTAIVGTVAATLFALLIGLGAMYSNKVEENAAITKDLSALQTLYDDQQAAIKADRENRQKLDTTVAASGQKFNDVKRAVEGFTGREAVLRAKPTLTEKMINDSFNAFTNEISCTTGDSTPCLRKP